MCDKKIRDSTSCKIPFRKDVDGNTRAGAGIYNADQ